LSEEPPRVVQLLSCHNGRLLTAALAEEALAHPQVFTTGLGALDALLPHQGFARGAVHEILSRPQHGTSRFFALMLARSAACAFANGRAAVCEAASGGAVIW
jgi:hypothetical protein